MVPFSLPTISEMPCRKKPDLCPRENYCRKSGRCRWDGMAVPPMSFCLTGFDGLHDPLSSRQMRRAGGGSLGSTSHKKIAIRQTLDLDQLNCPTSPHYPPIQGTLLLGEANWPESSRNRLLRTRQAPYWVESIVLSPSLSLIDLIDLASTARSRLFVSYLQELLRTDREPSIKDEPPCRRLTSTAALPIARLNDYQTLRRVIGI